MKKLVTAVGVATLIAAASAAWTLAAPAGKSTTSASAAAPAKLPPLPAAVKSRGRWVIGVKCDFPPFGYVTASGKHAGYDVEVAKAFARLAFGHGNRVSYVCVTTPSRIPALMSKRVDIIISTLTYTKARAQVIDFSVPYYGATGRLLVPNNSSIKTLGNLSGKTLSTTRGSIYDRWLSNCFKNTKVILTDTTSSAYLSVQDRRADGFMFDDAFLVGVASLDNSLKLTNDKFLNIPWGIGIRKGDKATSKWVNAALKYMKDRNEFTPILHANVPKKFWSSFDDNVPRKGKALFAYPVGKDLPSDCSGA